MHPKSECTLVSLDCKFQYHHFWYLIVTKKMKIDKISFYFILKFWKKKKLKELLQFQAPSIRSQITRNVVFFNHIFSFNKCIFNLNYKIKFFILIFIYSKIPYYSNIYTNFYNFISTFKFKNQNNLIFL